MVQILPTGGVSLSQWSVCKHRFPPGAANPQAVRRPKLGLSFFFIQFQPSLLAPRCVSQAGPPLQMQPSETQERKWGAEVVYLTRKV